MAFQRDYAARNMTSVADGNLSLNKEQKSSSEPIITVPGNLNGCFDCNICLDTSHDPVVTLCGHLYCWPCIYKWLKVQNPSPEPNNQHKCPVCKSHISSASLVPLYGRGTSPYDPEAENRKMAFDIPHRPQAPASNTFLASAASMSTDSSQPSRHNTFHHQQYISHPLNNYPSLTTSFYSPTIHMVGEMVFARIFGSSETNLFAYPSYSNSYAHPFSGNNSSPRLRRQEMQLDKSLTRVSVFLFCCIVLCLILF